MNENESKDHDIPLLGDAADEDSPPLMNVDIPVLKEVLTQEALDKILASSLTLPDNLQQELTTRITQLVQARLGETLPRLMLVVQHEIIKSVNKHIADALPEILKELVKPDAEKL